jgi:hypothetical protein
MDKKLPYVGERSPVVRLEAGTPHGISQSRIVLVGGRSYTGRVILEGTPGAKVNVSLVWGPNVEDRQTITIDRLATAYASFPLKFTPRSDSNEGRFEIAGTGQGSFHIGAASLMPADNVSGFKAASIRYLKEQGRSLSQASEAYGFALASQVLERRSIFYIIPSRTSLYLIAGLPVCHEDRYQTGRVAGVLADVARRHFKPMKGVQDFIAPSIRVDATHNSSFAHAQEGGQLMCMNGKVQRGAPQRLSPILEGVIENFPDTDKSHWIHISAHACLFPNALPRQSGPGDH